MKLLAAGVTLAFGLIAWGGGQGVVRADDGKAFACGRCMPCLSGIHKSEVDDEQPNDVEGLHECIVVECAHPPCGGGEAYASNLAATEIPRLAQSAVTGDVEAAAALATKWGVSFRLNEAQAALQGYSSCDGDRVVVHIPISDSQMIAIKAALE